MELHQLKYFVQIARLESVSEASQALHVSQPALSKAIAKLEKELGCTLFDRSGKRLFLNDRGKYFLKEVESALVNLQSAASAVGSPALLLGGSVRVGVFGPQLDAVLCLQPFMKAHPDINVLFDARQRSATARVTREFDVVFYPESPSFSGIAGIPYAKSRLRIAMPAAHPLAIASSVDLAQFKDDPFIFLNTTAGTYEQAYQLCLDSGFTPRVRAVVSSGMAQLRFVEAGLGVALVNESDSRAQPMTPSEAASGSARRLSATAPKPLSPAPAPATAASVEEEPSRSPQQGGVRYAALDSPTFEQTLCFATRPVHLLSAAGHELLKHLLRYFSLPESSALTDRFERN